MIVVVRELRQRVNQASISGVFRECIEIFNMAGDRYESHALALLFFPSLSKLFNGLDNDPVLQDFPNRKLLQLLFISKLKILFTF